jgi:hypothetical protein
VIQHGYGPYSSGKCRCTICGEAKRARVRQLRLARRRDYQAHQALGTSCPHEVVGITHGVNGYVNFYCRCLICTEAKYMVDIDDWDKRRRKQAVITVRGRAKGTR